MPVGGATVGPVSKRGRCIHHDALKLVIFQSRPSFFPSKRLRTRHVHGQLVKIAHHFVHELSLAEDALPRSGNQRSSAHGTHWSCPMRCLLNSASFFGQLYSQAARNVSASVNVISHAFHSKGSYSNRQSYLLSEIWAS